MRSLIKLNIFRNQEFKMVYMTIPEMNRKLEEVSHFFIERSKAFTSKIQLHEGRFREEDFTDFERLLD